MNRYLVTTFMDITLQERLHGDEYKDIKLNNYERASYTYQILRGLKYLHSCDIIHRVSLVLLLIMFYIVFE